MARPMGKMTAQIENFIRMEARGEDYDTILKEIFDITPDHNQEKKHAAQCKMHRWRTRPDAPAIWEDELKATVRRCVPMAVSKIRSQVSNENDWVANKASNDIMNLARSTGIFGNEERALTVRVEGIPEIGSPDDE